MSISPLAWNSHTFQCTAHPDGIGMQLAIRCPNCLVVWWENVAFSEVTCSFRGALADRHPGNQCRHNWQGKEHDGLLGSGVFPRIPCYAGTSASSAQGTGYQLTRNAGGYKPTRQYQVCISSRHWLNAFTLFLLPQFVFLWCKARNVSFLTPCWFNDVLVEVMKYLAWWLQAPPVSRKNVDLITTETSGSFENWNKDRVEEERKRRGSTPTWSYVWSCTAAEYLMLRVYCSIIWTDKERAT